MTPDLYSFRTDPFPHQRACFLQSATKVAFAFRLDPGLGKSKITLDTAAFLFERGNIAALLIAAPNDVHAQWIDEQIPLHLPERIKYEAVIWRASKQSSRKEAQRLLQPRKGAPFLVLAMNHEAFATQSGREIARDFLKAHPTLFALDDSHEFRTPSAARTRAVATSKGALCKLAKVRRILTGTLTGGTPFHFYSQYKFLDPRIINCDSYLAFKHRYAEFEKRTVFNRKKQERQEFEELKAFRNIDHLTQLIAPYTFIQRKEDCEGLPPKIYQRLPTHLSAAQQSLYATLLSDGIALLEQLAAGHPIKLVNPALLSDEDLAERILQSSNKVSYQIKLTLLLRLQQAAAGIVTDDAGHSRWIDGHPTACPRFAAALKWATEAQEQTGKSIIWSTFRPTLDALHEHIPNCVVVHGGVKGAARAEALSSFKDPHSSVRTLCAHSRTAGTGQNFEIASSVLYYARSFSYFDRAQSEDRAHRLSSRGTVTITDLWAPECSTDAKELDALKAKRDMVERLESFDVRSLK